MRKFIPPGWREGEAPSEPKFEHHLIQPVLGAGGVFPVEQEADEFGGPELAALLEEELQFAQQVLVHRAISASPMNRP